MEIQHEADNYENFNSNEPSDVVTSEPEFKSVEEDAGTIIYDGELIGFGTFLKEVRIAAGTHRITRNVNVKDSKNSSIL